MHAGKLLRLRIRTLTLPFCKIEIARKLYMISESACDRSGSTIVPCNTKSIWLYLFVEPLRFLELRESALGSLEERPISERLGQLSPNMACDTELIPIPPVRPTQHLRMQCYAGGKKK